MIKLCKVYLGKPPVHEEIFITTGCSDRYLTFINEDTIQIINWRFYNSINDLELFLKIYYESAEIIWSIDPRRPKEFHNINLFDIPVLKVSNNDKLLLKLQYSTIPLYLGSWLFTETYME